MTDGSKRLVLIAAISVVFSLCNCSTCAAFSQARAGVPFSLSSSCRGSSLCLRDTESPLMETAATKKRRWWARRAISKVLKRGDKERILASEGRRRIASDGAESSPTRMQMTIISEDLEILEASPSLSNVTKELFLQQDFENYSPSGLFDGERLRFPRDLIVSEEEDEEDEEEPTNVNNNNNNNTAKKRDWLTLKFEDILAKLIHNWSVEPPQDFKVEVSSRGNWVGRLLRGQYKGGATMSWSSLKSGNLQVSAGTLSVKLMVVNMLSFVKQATVKRYPKPFELQFDQVKFTSQDLYESDCIRNGLEKLLRRAMKRYLITPKEVKITSIQIKNSRVSIVGRADLAALGSGVFEVSSQIATASRGHVVTFPDLAINFVPKMGLITPILPGLLRLNLDVGHNTKFSEIILADDTLEFTATAKVTPNHTLVLPDFHQNGQSYWTMFSFDVGKWITQLGRFSE